MTPTRVIDTQRLSTLANAYQRDMLRFLRDLVAIPSPSGQEGAAIQRIRSEMEKAGFDEIRVDPMGNILGRIGSGRKVVMMDAHADTAGAGDPIESKVEDGYVYGRGACHQRAGIVSLVYAGKLIQELGMYENFTLWVVGSVQKLACEGLSWLYILKEDGIRPDCVVITQPTSLRIHRGHPGRMEMAVGGGNALQRPLAGVAGETRESALAEAQAVPGMEGLEVGIAKYDEPSYTGLRYPMEKYFPAWALEETHPLTESAIATYEALFELPPMIGKWAAGTNGVGTMGLMGVPTIGFGPGEAGLPTGDGERVSIRHLVKAAQFYAAFPLTYVNTVTRR